MQSRLSGTGQDAQERHRGEVDGEARLRERAVDVVGGVRGMAGEPRGVWGARRPDALRTTEGQEGTVARDGVWGGRDVEEETSECPLGKLSCLWSDGIYLGVKGSTGECIVALGCGRRGR